MPTKKRVLTTIIVMIVVLLAYFLPKWRLYQKEKAMNEMLMDHGILSTQGELLEPYK